MIMEFEEMKRIWDTQNNEAIYAIDEEALHRRVISKNMGIRRMATHSELGLLAICLVVALVMIIEGVFDNELYQLPQGAIFLFIAGYIWWDRRKRLENEGQSDHTLLGDLEQAIRTIDYHIRRQRNFLWWFMVPAAVATLLSFPFTYGGKPAWLWLLVLASFAVAYWVVGKELRSKILPKREELESLRRLLIEPNGE